MSDSLYAVPSDIARKAAEKCVSEIEAERTAIRERFIAEYLEPRWWKRKRTREMAEKAANDHELHAWHCEWSAWYVGGPTGCRARDMIRSLRAVGDKEPVLLCSEDAALVARYKETTCKDN